MLIRSWNAAASWSRAAALRSGGQYVVMLGVRRSSNPIDQAYKQQFGSLHVLRVSSTYLLFLGIVKIVVLPSWLEDFEPS